jgi:hypothetical protein
MASYRGHLALSSVLGAAYGGVGALLLGLDWGPVFLGAGLTTLGGLLPDLDSDSGVPVREMFGLAAAITPLLLLGRLKDLGFSTEQMLVVMASVYVFIRYPVRYAFQRLTVHRGMFHSIPAMCVVGLIIFLLHFSPDRKIRLFLAGGTMLGFLSHLVLDELCSVTFMGRDLRLNKYAGSALKLVSPSVRATLTTYGILASLASLAWFDVS